MPTPAASATFRPFSETETVGCCSPTQQCRERSACEFHECTRIQSSPIRVDSRHSRAISSSAEIGSWRRSDRSAMRIFVDTPRRHRSCKHRQCRPICTAVLPLNTPGGSVRLTDALTHEQSGATCEKKQKDSSSRQARLQAADHCRRK